MRSLASPLAFFFALTLQAQPPKQVVLAPPEPQALENIKQFAAAHFDPRESLSCTEVEAGANTKTITVEFLDPSTPHHGTTTSINPIGLFQNVFSVQSGTGFEWNNWGTIRGKKMAVYRYSNQFNGKTHAGLVFADENTGAISRITFRGTDTTAHLFCTAPSR
jgi:hypothetical protein